jgi:phosphohistidine phosphatase
MKKLFIVRHAKSSWDFPELDDLDRPLNKRGKKNAPQMGSRLAKRGIKPQLIITSPAKRAAATAREIAKELSFPKSDIIKEPLLYHGTNKNIIQMLQKQNNDINEIMIFGHNPGLTDLANYLSGSHIYNIPTCGIAEIDFEIFSWADIDEKKGVLVYFDYPKKSLIDH